MVADARNLTDAFVLDLGEEEDANVEVTASPFDAVLEKGTLDAIYLSGGSNKTTCMQYLEMAITELCGTIRPGGIFMSIAGVMIDEINSLFEARSDEWKPLVSKDELYTTEDGYTSNNIDAALMVWQKKGPE